MARAVLSDARHRAVGAGRAPTDARGAGAGHRHRHGCGRAGPGLVYGSGATAPGAVVFAAMYPDRVDGLVLLVPFLSGPLADDPDLTGWEPGAARRWAEAWLEAADHWGTGVMVDVWDPVIASKSVYRQAALLERTSPAGRWRRRTSRPRCGATCRASPAQVQCPVRVLHNPTNTVPEAVSRHAAELFPAGELVVLRPSEPGMSWARPSIRSGSTMPSSSAAGLPRGRIA